jgi:ABC-type branched-subunit amino acid transport system substrate-binding protein
MIKKNVFFYAVITGVVIIILFAFLFNIYFKNNNQIKIGLILPMTGGTSSGDELLKGIQLAADEANKWGGINNKKIKLIIRDCESNPDKAVQLFYEIEKKEKPLFYVTSLSVVSLKLAEEAEKNKVILFSLTSTAPEITLNKKYVYRYWLLPNNEVEPLFKIFEKISINNIGLVYLNDSFGNSIKNDLIKTNTKYKISSLPFESAQKDFDKISKGMMDKDAVCLIAYDSHVAPIINSLLKNNYKGQIIGINTIIISYLRGDFKLDKFYGNSPLIYNENYQFSKRIKENFEKKFQTKFNHFAGDGYDMSQIVFDLLKDKNISRSLLGEYLNNGFVHTGIFGTIVVKKGIHDFMIDLYPVKVEKGKIIYDW